MKPLDASLEAGTRLAVRIGLHTGPVLIAGGGEVFGETPNIAARVQSAADPDLVVSSRPQPSAWCRACGEHGHAPPAAGGAESALLAGEGDQDLARAATTAKAGEAAGHDAAAEKRPQFLLDEAR